MNRGLWTSTGVLGLADHRTANLTNRQSSPMNRRRSFVGLGWIQTHSGSQFSTNHSGGTLEMDLL